MNRIGDHMVTFGRLSLLLVGLFASASVTAAPTQILPAEKLATYRAALPQIGAPQVDALMRDESTLWYDSTVMIPSYQDSVGDGYGTPIGARANSTGKAIIVPEGKKFFSADGKTWSFPFGHTAGTDQSDNVHVIDFLHLPSVGGQLLPVVYSVKDEPNGKFGLGLHQWSWIYPKGSVVGEMIFVKANSGKLLPVELRTRTRLADKWAVNIFRPFPTAKDLSAAIRKARPEWENDASLRRLVEHLDNDQTLIAKTVPSPGFHNAVTLSGYLDVLPDFGDDALVEELLATTPFVAAYGAVWKRDGEKKAFAASTGASLSIVPRNYFAGLIEVNEASCARCHKDAGRSLEDFEPATVLYGDVWGSDHIFSFHPWDQSRYRIFNNENRKVRPEFQTAGLVERFDSRRHPADYYRPVAP